MANSTDDKQSANGVSTRLAHSGRSPSEFHGFVNTPVYRGSTVLFDTAERLVNKDQKYLYGRRGSPTIEALETMVAELEGSHRTVITPSGLAAITGTLIALTSAGDHVLMVDTVYQPARQFCDHQLSRLGVEITYYDPLVGSDISHLLRENTRVVFTESPGSQTFEMQDIPAIAAQNARRAYPRSLFPRR